MRTYRKELFFKTAKRVELINITRQLEECLKESGIKDGLMLVNAMHITAAVFINDDESGLHYDILSWLEKIVPDNIALYRHNLTGETNAAAHLKREILGRAVLISITAGAFDFGPWEQVFYGEFDGQRAKKVLVKIIGE